MTGRTRLLAIYATEDALMWQALERHLASLRNEGLLSGWHAGLLRPGAEVARELAAQVAQADLVLLLLSADFMASDQCQALLAQVQKERAARPLHIVPVLVRPVDWRGSEVQGLQPLPRSGQAVSLWMSQDAAWLEVVETIRGLLTSTTASPQLLTSTAQVPSVPQPFTPQRPIMSTPKAPPGSRSVNIGRDAVGSVIVVGDHNTVEQHYLRATLPKPESVDLRAEVRAIHQILTALQSEDKRRIERALEEATEEADKPAPRKEVIGESVEKALTIAKKATAFAEAAGKLQPHVASVTAWLGAAWHKLLPIVGSFG